MTQQRVGAAILAGHSREIGLVGITGGHPHCRRRDIAGEKRIVHRRLVHPAQRVRPRQNAIAHETFVFDVARPRNGLHGFRRKIERAGCGDLSHEIHERSCRRGEHRYVATGGRLHVRDRGLKPPQLLAIIAAQCRRPRAAGKPAPVKVRCRADVDALECALHRGGIAFVPGQERLRVSDFEARLDARGRVAQVREDAPSSPGRTVQQVALRLYCPQVARGRHGLPARPSQLRRARRRKSPGVRRPEPGEPFPQRSMNSRPCECTPRVHPS